MLTKPKCRKAIKNYEFYDISSWLKPFQDKSVTSLMKTSNQLT